MTKKEIEMSGIENYIAFLKDEVNKYYDYMNENIGGAKVAHRMNNNNMKRLMNNFVEETMKKIEKNVKNLHDNIEQRADEDAKEITSAYFKILCEKFDKYADSDLRTFKKKFENFVDKFTKSTED